MKWEEKHPRIVVYLDHITLKGIEAAMVVKGKSRSAIIEEAVRRYLENMKGAER